MPRVHAYIPSTVPVSTVKLFCSLPAGLEGRRLAKKQAMMMRTAGEKLAPYFNEERLSKSSSLSSRRVLKEVRVRYTVLYYTRTRMYEVARSNLTGRAATLRLIVVTGARLVTGQNQPHCVRPRDTTFTILVLCRVISKHLIDACCTCSQHLRIPWPADD